MKKIIYLLTLFTITSSSAFGWIFDPVRQAPVFREGMHYLFNPEDYLQSPGGYCAIPKTDGTPPGLETPQAPVRLLEYEQCSENNNYLQARIPDSNTSAATLSSDPLALCIQESMKQGPRVQFQYPSSWRRNRHYAYCPEGATQPDFSKVYQRPCNSMEYHRFIYDSYKNVTACLNLDQKEYFAIINHESQFRTLIGNPNRVYGAGQLTGISIAEVHRRLGVNEDTDLRAAMERKFGRLPTSCERIDSILSDPIDVVRRGDSYSASTCERTALPQNPTRAFLYGGLIYQFYKQDALDDIVRYRTQLAGRDLEYIAKKLSITMYNGGKFGTLNAFDSFVESGDMSQYSSDQQLLEGFRTYLSENYGGRRRASAARRTEVAGYLGKVIGEVSDIEDGLADDGYEVSCKED